MRLGGHADKRPPQPRHPAAGAAGRRGVNRYVHAAPLSAQIAERRAHEIHAAAARRVVCRLFGAGAQRLPHITGAPPPQQQQRSDGALGRGSGAALCRRRRRRGVGGERGHEDLQGVGARGLGVA